MRKPLILSLLAGAGLAACVSVDPENHEAMNTAAALPENGSILFYREHSPQARLADAYLGNGAGYFVSLGEDQFSRISVPAGFHAFKVRAQGSVAFNAEFKVNAGETVCVETRPNHEELEWLVVPFLNALIPSFVLEETACPSAAALDKLAAN